MFTRNSWSLRKTDPVSATPNRARTTATSTFSRSRGWRAASTRGNSGSSSVAVRISGPSPHPRPDEGAQSLAFRQPHPVAAHHRQARLKRRQKVAPRRLGTAAERAGGARPGGRAARSAPPECPLSRSWFCRTVARRPGGETLLRGRRHLAVPPPGIEPAVEQRPAAERAPPSAPRPWPAGTASARPAPRPSPARPATFFFGRNPPSAISRRHL